MTRYPVVNFPEEGYSIPEPGMQAEWPEQTFAKPVADKPGLFKRIQLSFEKWADRPDVRHWADILDHVVLPIMSFLINGVAVGLLIARYL